MDTKGAQILLVEDDPAMGRLLIKGFHSKGFEATHVTTALDALRTTESNEFDAVVSDVRLGAMTGLELCEKLVSRRPDVPVILITAFGDLDTAIAAIRAGAHDFLPKPFELDELALRVSRAVEVKLLRAEVRRLREGVFSPLLFDNMIGESHTMQRVFALIGRVAASDASVLITGETGTGKELVARAIHSHGTRTKGPFVAINCAAVPEQLLESELFGHVKGAFTDARAARGGLFVEARGGTIFLDEIAELPLNIQAKLLRVLQEHTVRPVGSDRELAVDVRVVCATHRDLDSRVVEGLFREDLYYRVNVLGVALPPLRERGGDVLMLATEYLKRISRRVGRTVEGIAPDAARLLMAYDWPGNVRELANAMERAVALAEYDSITVADLPEKIRNHKSSNVLVTGSDASELVSLEEVERRYVLRVMQAVGGNRTRAAEVLSVDRKTLYSKLKMYGWKAPET
jgi:two-component system, NtrC family, response regulator AtoC